MFLEVVIVPFAYFTDKKEHFSKNPVKQLLSQRPKNGFQDQISLNAGQKYCRMLHSAIFWTFIKLPVVIKTFVLSIFKWPFYTGFTVFRNCNCSFLITLQVEKKIIIIPRLKDRDDALEVKLLYKTTKYLFFNECFTISAR